MRPVLLASALALGALLAGCAAFPLGPVDHGGLPVTRPAGWNETPEFVAFDGGRTHRAHQDLKARAPDGWDGGIPAACQAYQEGRHTRGDSCRIVHAEPERWTDTTAARPQWYIEARWDGNGQDLLVEERDETRRTVVVYDADGRAVGHVPQARAFIVE